MDCSHGQPSTNACHVSTLSRAELGEDVCFFDAKAPAMTIHEAAYSGDISQISELLKSGTPVDLPDELGLTPLIVATLANKIAAVQFLLDSGSDVNIYTRHYGSALHIASRQGDLPMVKTLLSGGADCSTKGPTNKTCLVDTALSGQLDVIKLLLQDGGQIDDTNIDGLTPLHAAVSSGHTEVALYLIQCGASVNKTDSRGNLALHYAVKERDATTAEALIRAGSKIDHMNTSSESPLHIAIRVEHLPTIWLLVGSGCNVNICKPDGSGVVHLLVSKYQTSNLADFRQILDALLLRGCDLNTVAYSTLETPLYRAIGLQKYEFAEILLAYGADPNISCPFGITALQLACRNERMQTVQMMLHWGIDWKREKWLLRMPMPRACDTQATESQDSAQNLLKVISDWKLKLNPLSLQNLSRIGLRKHYGDKLLKTLNSMDKIPLAAKNYLLLADISKNSLVNGSVGHVTRWLSETDEVLRDGRYSPSQKNSDLMEDLHV